MSGSRYLTKNKSQRINKPFLGECSPPRTPGSQKPDTSVWLQSIKSNMPCQPAIRLVNYHSPPPKKKTHFISDHQRSWWNHKKNPAGKQQKYTNKGVQISQWIGSFSRHYGQQWFVAGGHLSIGHIGVLAPVPQRLDSGPSDSLGTKLLREFIEVRNCWVKQPFEKACGSRTLTHFATLTNT